MGTQRNNSFGGGGGGQQTLDHTWLRDCPAGSECQGFDSGNCKQNKGRHMLGEKKCAGAIAFLIYTKVSAAMVVKLLTGAKFLPNETRDFE